MSKRPYGATEVITVARTSLDLDDAQFGINTDAVVRALSTQLDPLRPYDEGVSRTKLTLAEILAKRRELLPDVIIQSIRTSVGPLGEAFPLEFTSSISWSVPTIMRFEPQPAELSVLNTAPRITSFTVDSMAGRLEYRSQGFLIDEKAMETGEGVQHYGLMMRQFLSNFYLTLAEQLRKDFLTQPDYWFAPEKRFANNALQNMRIEDVIARRTQQTLAVTKYRNGILMLIDQAENVMQREGAENLPTVIFTTRETRRTLATHNRDRLLQLTEGPAAVTNRRGDVTQIKSRNRSYTVAASPVTPGDEVRKYNTEAPLMGELVTGGYCRFRNADLARPDCVTNGYKTWKLIDGLLGCPWFVGRRSEFPANADLGDSRKPRTDRIEGELDIKELAAMGKDLKKGLPPNNYKDINTRTDYTSCPWMVDVFLRHIPADIRDVDSDDFVPVYFLGEIDERHLSNETLMEIAKQVVVVSKKKYGGGKTGLRSIHDYGNMINVEEYTDSGGGGGGGGSGTGNLELDKAVEDALAAAETLKNIQENRKRLEDALAAAEQAKKEAEQKEIAALQNTRELNAEFESLRNAQTAKPKDVEMAQKKAQEAEENSKRLEKEAELARKNAEAAEKTLNGFDELEEDAVQKFQEAQENLESVRQKVTSQTQDDSDPNRYFIRKNSLKGAQPDVEKLTGQGEDFTLIKTPATKRGNNPSSSSSSSSSSISSSSSVPAKNKKGKEKASTNIKPSTNPDADVSGIKEKVSENIETVILSTDEPEDEPEDVYLPASEDGPPRPPPPLPNEQMLQEASRNQSAKTTPDSQPTATSTNNGPSKPKPKGVPQGANPVAAVNMQDLVKGLKPLQNRVTKPAPKKEETKRDVLLKDIVSKAPQANTGELSIEERLKAAKAEKKRKDEEQKVTKIGGTMLNEAETKRFLSRNGEPSDEKDDGFNGAQPGFFADIKPVTKAFFDYSDFINAYKTSVLTYRQVQLDYLQQRILLLHGRLSYLSQISDGDLFDAFLWLISAPVNLDFFVALASHNITLPVLGMLLEDSQTIMTESMVFLASNTGKQFILEDGLRKRINYYPTQRVYKVEGEFYSGVAITRPEGVYVTPHAVGRDYVGGWGNRYINQDETGKFITRGSREWKETVLPRVSSGEKQGAYSVMFVPQPASAVRTTESPVIFSSGYPKEQDFRRDMPIANDPRFSVAYQRGPSYIGQSYLNRVFGIYKKNTVLAPIEKVSVMRHQHSCRINNICLEMPTRYKSDYTGSVVQCPSRHMLGDFGEGVRDFVSTRIALNRGLTQDSAYNRPGHGQNFPY